MDTEIKAGVVGVGHLGRHHARIYHQLPGVHLVGVADPEEKQGKKIAKSHRAEYYSNYTELLGKVDVVSIASPTITHFEIAKAFLESGSHVLVEKPITDSLETAQELVQIAKANNKKLQVGHVERFNPAVMELLKRDLRPIFIEASRISPFRFRSGDVSVVLDLMIHDLDIICMLANSPIERVDAVGVNLFGKNEDIANARITFKAGCVANVSASRAAIKAVRHIRIFTPDTYVSLDYGSQKGRVITKPADLDLSSVDLQRSVPKKFLGLSFEEIFFGRMLKVEKLSMKSHEPLYVQLESFINCVLEDKRPIVSGEDGVTALQTAKMITEDIQKNLARLKQNL